MATDEKEIKEVFGLFDIDKDGKIDATEIGTLMRALGKTPLQSEVKQIEKEQGKAPVDYNKFFAYYKRVRPAPPGTAKSQILAAFQLLDPTGRGTIHVNELRRLLTCGVGEPLYEEDLKKILVSVPPDKTGNIQYKQLVDVIAI